MFVLLMVGVLGGMFAVLANVMCGQLAEMGLDWLYFVIMGMMAVLLAFIIPFCVLIISLFIFMAIWNDELLSAICSLALLIPYYYILWLNKTRMGKKFSFSIKPID